MPRGRFISVLLAILVASPFLIGCGGEDSDTAEPSTPFEPNASLTAIGGTERIEKPELVLRVETRPGDAGIRSAKLTLPAAFIADQTALGDICGEGELEKDDCAGRRRLGTSRVVSRLYDEPLTGPVYPVSGSGGLPRLAYLLDGPVELLLRGRIAVLGSRIQAGIEDVPNTPLKTFELRIAGGKPGYLILSSDICRRQATATVSFTSQDGQDFTRRIPLEATCPT